MCGMLRIMEENNMANETESKKRGFSKKHFLWVIIILIIILSSFAAALLIIKNNPGLVGLSQSKEKVSDEADKLVSVVSGLMMLPDERPTIATVTDKEKLSSQTFFAESQNGDKVLIFTQAKKAVLYRPSTNKIIDVAPVSIGGDATASAKTEKQPVSFVLYNGTSVTGFTKTYETKLATLVQNALVVDRDNAKKRDYATSLLVDLTGTKPGVTVELSKTLGIASGELPEGETKPTTGDFLIILGEDKK